VKESSRIRAKKRRLKKRLRARYGDICLKCRHSQFRLTLDHVVPEAQGGTLTIDNLQLLCQPCNEAKGNTHVDYRPALIP
jgi:5-methylcytosine-specific restriction endonuclease McrA